MMIITDQSGVGFLSNAIFINQLVNYMQILLKSHVENLTDCGIKIKYTGTPFLESLVDNNKQQREVWNTLTFGGIRIWNIDVI